MIYCLLADGFEEIEALCPVDILRRGGRKVTVVSFGHGTEVCGAHGITVKADITVHELLASDAWERELEMLIFPGGMPGAKNLDTSPETDRLLSVAKSHNAFLCAICAAPMILGKRGFLKNRRATCYPSFETYFDGAVLSDESVVRDGKIITANGMGAALSFGVTLLSALAGDEEGARIRASVLAK